MNKDNVVIFPKGKKDSPPQSIEEIIQDIVQVRMTQIDMIADELTDHFMYACTEEGFDLYKDEFSNIVALVNEAIRAAMLKVIGADHGLLKLADDVFDEEESEENADC